MPKGRFAFAAATAADGGVYLVGGATDFSGAKHGTSLTHYDPSTDRYEELPDAPMAGGWAGAFVAGRLVVNAEAVGIYDPSTRTWSRSENAPAGVDQAIVTAGPDGLAYFLGAGGQVDAYDPVMDAWTSLPAMPISGDGVAAVSVKGQIYVVGTEAAVFDLGQRSWTTLAAPPTPRYFGSAAVDSHGRILLMGGVLPGKTGTSDIVEAYDPSAAVWSSANSLSLSVMQAAAAAGCDGAVYVFGGDSSQGGILDYVQMYTPAGKWLISPATGSQPSLPPADDHPTIAQCVPQLPAAHLPEALFGEATAAAPDGSIYVVGGYHAEGTGNPVLSVLHYDTAQGTYQPLPAAPIEQQTRPAAAFVAGRLVVSAGEVASYDVQTKTWTKSQTAPAIGNSDRLAAAGADGRVYFLHDQARDGTSSYPFNAYDPVADTWAALPEAPFSGNGGSALSLGKSIYIIGTETSVYSLETNAWYILPAPPTPRYWAAAAVDGAGRLFLIGGYDPRAESMSAATELYDPRAQTWTSVEALAKPQWSASAAVGCDGRVFLFGGQGYDALSNDVLVYSDDGHWLSSH